MSVRLGSGRSSNYNTASQVSIQDYYNPRSSGYWLGFEPKKNGEALAKAMKELCGNDHILYSQPKRNTAWEVFEYFDSSIAKICHKVYVDCSSGVRLCIRQAFHVMLPDFTTANEPTVLKNSGLFKEAKRITKPEQCTEGMVLVTPNKGHTVIVISAEDNKTKIKDNNLESVARDVIKGKYGVGEERRIKLSSAGYDYDKVQKLVNKLLSK